LLGSTTVGGAAADVNVITIPPVSDFTSILIRIVARPEQILNGGAISEEVGDVLRLKNALFNDHLTEMDLPASSRVLA